MISAISSPSRARHVQSWLSLTIPTFFPVTTEILLKSATGSGTATDLHALVTLVLMSAVTFWYSLVQSKNLEDSRTFLSCGVMACQYISMAQFMCDVAGHEQVGADPRASRTSTSKNVMPLFGSPLTCHVGPL